MKKLLALLMVLAMLVFCLTACGKKEEAKNAATEAVEEVKDAAADAADTATEAVDDAKEAAEDAVEAGKEAVADAAEEVKDAAADAVEAGKEAVADAADAATEAVADAKDAAEGAVEEVKDAAADAVESGKEAVADAAETATEAVADAKDAAADAVEAGKEAVADAAETATEAVADAKDAAEGAVEEAKDAVEGAAEEVKDAAEGAVEGAEEAAAEVVEKAEEAATEAVETATEAAEDAAETTTEAAEEAVEAVEEVAEEAEEVVEEAAEEAVVFAEFDPAATGAQDIAVTSARDTQIPVTVVIPEGVEEYPLVVLVHGHGGTRNENIGYPAIAEALAAKGIASIRMDFPGCGQSTESFQVNTLTNMKADVRSCIAWAKENLKVTKLGLFGYSMGGRIAVELLAEGEAFDAVAMLAPAADNTCFKGMFDGEEGENALYNKAQEEGYIVFTTQYGQVQELSKEWYNDLLVNDDFDALMAKVTGNYQGPAVVIWAEDDSVVPPTTSEAVAKAMGAEIINANGNNHSYGFYPNGDDDTVANDVRAIVVNGAADFFANAFAAEAEEAPAEEAATEEAPAEEAPAEEAAAEEAPAEETEVAPAA